MLKSQILTFAESAILKANIDLQQLTQAKNDTLIAKSVKLF